MLVTASLAEMDRLLSFKRPPEMKATSRPAEELSIHSNAAKSGRHRAGPCANPDAGKGPRSHGEGGAVQGTRRASINTGSKIFVLADELIALSPWEGLCWLLN